MSVQVFALSLFVIVSLLSSYAWSVSTVETPLEQYESSDEDKDGEETTDTPRA